MIVALSFESPILHKWRNFGTHACIYTRIWIYKSTNATTHDPLCILYFKHVWPDTIVCKQFWPWSGTTKHRAWLGSKLFFTLWRHSWANFEHNQQMHYNLHWVSISRLPAEQKCNSQATDNCPEIIKKLFSCSTQLSIKFILLINVKMPTIVGNLTFISRINTTSERLKARIFFIYGYFSFDEQLNFHAQLSRVEHKKCFITSSPGISQMIKGIYQIDLLQILTKYVHKLNKVTCIWSTVSAINSSFVNPL